MNQAEQKSTNHPVASGVEALLNRLREEGVASGQARAEAIVAEAERRAKWLVDQAQQESESLREKARTDAERFKKAGEDALRVATRDALLHLRTQLTQRFSGEVQRLVSEEVKKKEMLQQMILEIVGRVSEQAAAAKTIEMLLPSDVVGLDELRQRPEELGRDELSQFVKAISQDMARGEGISFGVIDDKVAGLRLRLTEQGIVLDLSDQAIAALLLQHLQPRFRALLEGIVK
jgi:V/A-type H+-transporting ATPase subunit E